MVNEKDWKNIDDQLQTLFWKWYYLPLISILGEDRYTIKNANNNDLIEAIKKGTVVYRDGEFSGSFNSRISRELSKFAKYDGRSKTWKGRPPADVLGAAVIANDRAADLNRKMSTLLDNIDSTVKSEIQKIVFDVTDAVKNTSDKTAQVLGVSPEITKGMADNHITEYTNTMRLNIVNEDGPGDWNSEQITRLRDMIQRNVTKGFGRKQMIDSIQAEWDTSQKKAKFLARQETNLFISELENAQYQDAGLQLYEWMTSRDARVVGNPGGKYPNPSKGHGNHYVMQGKICRFSDPTVYADSLDAAKAGKWKSKASIGAGDRHAGEEFLCRCTKKPIIL